MNGPRSRWTRWRRKYPDFLLPGRDTLRAHANLPVTLSLLRSSSRSEMTCYPDIWALGISMLTYLDPGYVNANCLNQDHLLSFRAAFGYRDGVFGKADSWDTVWQAVENVAEFYSPLFHEKTFYSDEGGRVDRAVWSGLLNTLLVVPQVRCK